MTMQFLFRGRWGLLCLSILGILYGQTPAVGQYNLLAQKDGPVASDKLGWCVAGTGDVNGDGVPDYMAGMPYYDPSGLSSAGAAVVYSGANGSVLYQKNGAAAAEGLGYYVAGAGDVNGDGRADIIVASQAYAFVYSGANGGLLYQKAAGGPVAGAGDINDDARADFIVSNSSQSMVYSGATGALLYQKAGGTAVAGIGDVNGDGRADFLVCDQYADPGITNAGSAFVYSGSDGSLLYQKNGAAGSDLFGSSAAGLGDVDGDGRPDFIVGARLADVSGQVNAGAAYVYSGRTGALIYQKTGPAGQQWGQSVSGAGDANGDGRSDFLVATIWSNPGGLTSAGSVMLFSGANGTLLQQFDGRFEYENFGYALAALGDINGNGLGDFIIGGPNASPGGRLNAGSAYVFGSGAVGDPCANDAIAPVLTCAGDKRIGCSDAVVFDAPTATDNCDPTPTVNVVSTIQTAGPGPDEVTHTRTWTAADDKGNTSAACSQDIVVVCAQSLPNRSQVAEAGTSCGDFVNQAAVDLASICYSVKRGKITACTPNSFYYFVALTAPAAGFTVDIVQSRLTTLLPYVAVASRGVSLYDNCTSIGSGTSNAPGQAQVVVKGATAGKQYVIAVLYSTSSLVGTNVGTTGLNIIQHYDFSARINGQEIARDADGVGPNRCVQYKGSSGAVAASGEFSVESYPNPFNASVQVRYYLPESGPVRVDVYNVLGRPVRTLLSTDQAAGEYTVNWDGRDHAGGSVPSGIYLLRVVTRDEENVTKLNLLK